MKIGVISDTHDRFDGMYEGLAVFKNEQIDQIIHAGDWTTVETMSLFVEEVRKTNVPVLSVLGNNDREIAQFLGRNRHTCYIRFPLTKPHHNITLDNRRIAIYHGDNRDHLEKLVLSKTYDIVFCGHTHRVKIDYQDNVLIVNPGSTAFSVPRKKETRYVAIYETGDNSVRLISLPSI